MGSDFNIDHDGDATILHKDERLGHVAIDMRLMTSQQVTEVQARVLINRGAGLSSNFGEAAVELGFITPENLKAIEAEEQRRRRLIVGYEIIDIIGTGTIATVYHAKQIAMDREVALKILHPRLAGDPVFVRAYIAEAQAVSRFHHPHIVQGFDAGVCNGFYYFAHEYLPGGSIADRLRRGGDAARFSETRLLTYLRQTTSALKHAWAVAVYHGDINPGNLLLDAQRNIKLANLGVPRVAGLRPAKKAQKGKTNIMPGFIRCGPDYAAPEQLEKPELVNARTDIYNLGATFYHISFGAPPFRPPDGGSILDYRKANPMPPFSLERQEGFSGKFLRLIHDMLDPDPEKRPADPEELAARLERFHNADTDYLGTLARQVRQVPGPSTSTSARSVSARASQRLERIATAPSPSTGERHFSLSRRPGSARAGRNIWWLWAGVVATALAAVAGYFLKG